MAELQIRGNLARNEEGVGDRWPVAESTNQGIKAAGRRYSRRVTCERMFRWKCRSS